VQERRLRFGEALRERRLAAGLSQEELAERCGIDRKSISRMETGTFSPRLDSVWSVAEALDLSMATLFSGVAEDKPRRRRR
jgi:putative transcriptional regulator